MDERLNPYVPTVGAQPPELVGRTSFLNQAEVALDRALAGRYAKSLIAVGLRGVGKTVLLNRVAEMAERRDFRTAMIEAHEDKSLAALLTPQLRRITLELARLGALTARVKRLGGVLKSFISAVKITIGDIEFGVDLPAETGMRGELIAKGMIYSPSHGDTAFTVPLFDEFMRRAMPFEPG